MKKWQKEVISTCRRYCNAEQVERIAMSLRIADRRLFADLNAAEKERLAYVRERDREQKQNQAKRLKALHKDEE